MLRKFEIKAIPNLGGAGQYNITLKNILSYLGEAKISTAVIEFTVEEKEKGVSIKCRQEKTIAPSS